MLGDMERGPWDGAASGKDLSSWGPSPVKEQGRRAQVSVSEEFC